MKKKLLLSIATVVLLLFSITSYSQNENSVLNLGILESFEGFTGAGSIDMFGTSFIGDAGTNDGGFSGLNAAPAFIGNKYAVNATTAQARFDLFRFYIHINQLFVDQPDTHVAAFGSAAGEVITPGVYFVTGAASIGTKLILDGTTNGVPNPDAFFIIKCSGAFTVGAAANVILTGGTRSCNVFYVADGTINVAASAIIKGTLFSKGGAIGLGASVNLDGRMLTMDGSIAVGVTCIVKPPADLCTIPIFCETECSPAPEVDVLGSIKNYALYTDLGAVSNTAVTGIDGNIGALSGSYTGYASSIIVGDFHVADGSTTQAHLDLENAYTKLMALPNTIPSDVGVTPVVLLPHSPVFGSVVVNGIGGETVYPGVYNMIGIGTLGNTLILDGQGAANPIFVFKFSLAFNVSAGTKMILINGARRCNVFFIAGAGTPTGAIAIGANAHVQGTFLAHNGACGSAVSTFLAGRQLSTSGAITTYGGIIYNNPVCVTSVTLKTIAKTDSYSVLAGATTPSVISNDISIGVQAVIGTLAGQVILTCTPEIGSPLTMNNADGTITVAANALPGIYPITYTICEVSNPLICSTVTSNVTVTAPAATIWDGSTSTDWSDATNWSFGVPLPGGRVEIPGGLTNYPVLDQTRTIGNLIIAEGATLSLNNSTLVVSGTFTGTGTFIGGNATSGITINGLGDQGTFYMNQTTPGTTNKVGNFTLDSTPLGSATLGNTMRISGVLTLTKGTFKTGGNLTLTSNGSGTAVVAPILICDNVAITGDVTVERFFPAGRAFRLISSPVTTTTSIRDNWQEGANNPTAIYANNLNPNPGYGTHITGSMANEAALGFDATQTTNNSMFTFDNTSGAWASVPNTNVLKITAGVPYRLMIRGSRNINMDTNAPTADNTILRAKGALKICDAPAGTMSQAANGFSFIGNPYQATVDIKAVLLPSLINPNPNLKSNFYYVWDPKVSSRGAYVNYDLTDNLNPLGVSSSVNQYLQPWQACFVQTASAGVASITFQESNKSLVESVRENVFRTTNLASYIRLTLYESNTLVSNGAAADGLIEKFGDNYINAIDGNDALKFNNLDETFSTKNNTSLLGIESRLLPVASDIIPLNIAQYRFTNYTMVANGTNMSGLPAYLHDQLLQTYTEIPQSGSVNYSYVLDTNNAATSASDRFRIVFENPFLNLESNAALTFTMNPNPSKQGVFDVVMNEATEDTKLVIYNTIGQEVYATNLTQATINHITPNKVFAKGVYYVKIKKDTATTIKKLIIE